MARHMHLWDPEISSVGQSMALIKPRLHVSSPHGPFTLELDLMMPVGLFQIRIFCDCLKTLLRGKGVYKFSCF